MAFVDLDTADPATPKVVEEPNAAARRPLRRLQLLRELAGLVASPPPVPQSKPSYFKRSPSAPRRLSTAVEFDATGDLQYARTNALFSRVAHIFHQNWHGIRSAAGVLPGHKVAIPVHRSLHARDIGHIIAQLDEWKIDKAIFHGFSLEAEKVLRAVASASIPCYLVWHGNLSQLVWEPEVDYFELALRACKRGQFRRAHMIKANMGDVFQRSYEPMLLNSPPVTHQVRLVPAFAAKHRIALVSAHTDIRKNIHSNLVGAALSKSIHDVLYYGKIRGIIPAIQRCKRIRYAGHDKHIALLHNVDASVNVTTIDCHPMVDLEALGAGAFALTGPLFLDALQKHPYTQLSEIRNPFDVREIAARLNHVSEMNNSELQAVMSDYSQKLAGISHDRYAEFLGL